MPRRVDPWERHQELITRLYVDEQLSLKEVSRYLREEADLSEAK